MALTQVKGSVLPDEQTLQPGMIMMWAGEVNQVPTGWQLCNGSGTTSNSIQIPDLRDRFIVGSGSTYDTGDTGGSTSATTSSDGDHSHTVTVNSGGSHSHTVTVNSTTLSESQMPSHIHGTKGTYSGSNGTSETRADNFGGGNSLQSSDSYNRNVKSRGSSKSHNHSASSNSTGSHTHSASSNSTGSHSHTVSTMSPYYALAYIIKL